MVCLWNLMTIFSMISMVVLIDLKTKLTKSIILAYNLSNCFVAGARD